MNINFLINKSKNDSNFLKFQSIKISLASPKKIKQWTQTVPLKTNIIDTKNNNIKEKLNKGKILNPKTFNYKTLKPEKGGLFCETIFGSLKNLSSRRYKLGYIELVSPVTHIWYLKGSISYISIILNFKRKNLESIAYCLEFLSTQVKSFKHNLNYVNLSSILKNNLIGDKSILNSSIFNQNYNFLLLNNNNNLFIKNINTINQDYKKIYKLKKFYKLKNSIIGFNKNWINSIKLNNEPKIILRLSNPINLIIHSILKNNFKFNLLDLNINNKDFTKKSFNTNRYKVKNLIIKKNSYSIDFPILLFNNNKILQKLILNKKNSFFITNANLININNYKLKKEKNNVNILEKINLIYNIKSNNKTYFNNVNMFVNFSNFQEPPFKIFQSGFFYFNINKEKLIINNNILSFFIFNNYNLSNSKKINFKNYKDKLVTFSWWLYLNDQKQNFNSMNYKNFSLLYKPEIKNNFYLKDYNKENTKNKNKKVKYSSNILSNFYETYSQFEKINFIKTNKIFKLKYTKKIDIKKLHFTLSKLKTKIKYYNMNIINNLILLEKYYNQDEYILDNNINIKLKNKKIFFKKTLKNSDVLSDVCFFKIISYKKKLQKNKQQLIKINEYCFSIIRFQLLLKNLYSEYELNFINNSNFYINNKSNKLFLNYDLFKNKNSKLENNLNFSNFELNEKKQVKFDDITIKDIQLDKLEESNLLLLNFHLNLEDQKSDLVNIKLKNKLKNQLKTQFYLNKKNKKEMFNFYFIPRYFKINKKKLNFNNSIILNNVDYINFYYNNKSNINSHLKNPLGNNKFRKFITSILFTTIQKSLIICKIKLFKKLLISKCDLIENYNNINTYKENYYKKLIYNEKKQLIAFFFSNYGALTEFIAVSPKTYSETNSQNNISNEVINDKSVFSLNSNKNDNIKKFFDTYDLEENKIINLRHPNPAWLTRLNNNLNFFSFIWLDKKYLITLQKETNNFDLKICLNILQKDFKYLLKNSKKNSFFNEILLNLKQNNFYKKTNKLLNINESFINNDLHISKNIVLQKIVSFFGIYDHLFINFSYDFKYQNNTSYKNMELIVLKMEIEDIFSSTYIYIKNIIWHSKLKELFFFNNKIQIKEKDFIYEQYLYFDYLKNSLITDYNKVDNSLDYFTFNNLIEQFIFKNQLHFNKYYIISQLFLWNNQTDWETFLFYITKSASINDKIIPCYVDRSISFDQPQIGAIAIQNILKNFDISFLSSNKNMFENKNVISKSSLINLNQNNTKNYSFLYLYKNLNTVKTKKFISIELLISNIKNKVLILNKQIKYYENFLKFRIFFNDNTSNFEQSKQTIKLEKNNFKNNKFLLKLKDYNKFIKIFRKVETLRLLRATYFRRLKLLQPFLKKEVKAEWMILNVIPVLPPDLRPILVLDSQQVAVSDLNKLYQKVIFRNERLKRLSNDFYSLNVSPEMRYAQKLLQESVDALLENGKGDSKLFTSSNNRPLKSLSDMVKGKKGRFRQNLLGKRVDYSGRSVIVVGPNLKLYECGLPQEMAIELFQPFLIRQLLLKKFAKNFINAKRLIKNKSKIIWTIIKLIMENRPVLLNRAPTLHRLGIQAFKPKLVSGRAILLHPLVCSAFNADFDGDQMAVHVPIFYEACSEAWRLLCSRNNILSPATGDPIIVPSQDMVLGCYYLTTLDKIKRVKNFNYFNNYLLYKINQQDKLTIMNKNLFLIFSNIDQVFQLFNQKLLELHTLIWLKYNNKIEFNLNCQNCLEIQIDKSGNISKIYSEYKLYYNWQFNKTLIYIKTTPGRVLMNKLIFEVLFY
uniref:DNA-directed RNA polymerase subunit n=1 Tax=Ulva pseudorotundata TaxID=523339 RepID=A0A7L9K243_9CHLO|nr:DNA-directed RNA polymerase subunit beta [Ulva rigida]QOK35602.1 DNA-directed RNA polymerase subunit beta [Ulva rigida]